MAYPDHDNWYQRRSIRGGRRHAGDRDIQNLYSDGVRESKTSSIRGPHIAGTPPDLQKDLNNVISLMEGLITRISNNIAHQAQFAKQSQANLDQHLEQLQQKYLESKKKSDARFDAILARISKKASKLVDHEKEVEALEERDEVMEQDEEKTKNTVKEIQKIELTEKHTVGDLENCGEVVEEKEERVDSNDTEDAGNDVSTAIVLVNGEICEPTVAVTVSLDVNCEGGKNAFSVRSDNDDRMSIGKSNGRPANPEKRYDSMKAAHSIEMEYLGFCNMRTKKRRAELRESTRRLPVHSGEMKYLGFWKKKSERKRSKVRRQKRRSTNSPAYFSVASIFTGALRDGESPAKVRWRWRKQLLNRRGQHMAERYDKEERRSWGTHGLRVGHTIVAGKGGRGGGAAVGGGKESGSKVVRKVGVNDFRANEILFSAFEAQGSKAWGIRVRGMDVNSPHHHNFDDVMHSNFNPFLGPLFLY